MGNKNAKIYCLYHLMKDCPCIRPVTDEGQVIPRIEANIRRYRQLQKRASEKNKEAYGRDIALLNERLEVLRTKGGDENLNNKEDGN